MSTSAKTPAKKTATTSKTAAAKTVKAAAQIKETQVSPVAGNPTKIKTSKIVQDLSLRSYQELSKMYGSGFIGMSKTAIIDALNKRSNKN